jgi:hypothetical protein
MRRALALVLIAPMLLAAVPQPQGTLTLTDTTPVTFTATTSHIGRRDHVWVSTRCWDAQGNPTYYGEEIERNGVYVMDDTVWVLWFGTVAEGSCRAFLIFRDESTPGEIVLDDTGFFQAP